LLCNTIPTPLVLDYANGMNITQSAVGDKRGLWATVLVAIIIGEDE
jgi:hypothetical protein